MCPQGCQNVLTYFSQGKSCNMQRIVFEKESVRKIRGIKTVTYEIPLVLVRSQMIQMQKNLSGEEQNVLNLLPPNPRCIAAPCLD